MIEVMVAIAVLSFGLVYLSRAFNNCLNAMAQVSMYTTALNLAEEKFFEIKTEKSDKITASHAGESLSGYPDFSLEVEKEEIKELPLQDVNITVNWKQGRRTGNCNIRGYLPVKE